MKLTNLENKYILFYRVTILFVISLALIVTIASGIYGFVKFSGILSTGDQEVIVENTLVKPDLKKFPLLKILNYKFNNTFLEIIIVSLNDILVKKYIEYKIPYYFIHKKMLELLKKPYFTKYYSKFAIKMVCPNSIFYH